MPQVISASRRTDIPAFHSEWFMDCIRAGHCMVANPFNPRQVSRVSLKPEDVLAIVFWTRDAAPLIKHLDELDASGYKYYFQYTIIGYPRLIEPGVPSVDEAVDAFLALSGKVGRGRVVWRYDPILFSNLTPLEWHQRQFDYLLGRLAGHTGRVVISFLDAYRRMGQRFRRAGDEGLRLDANVFEPSTYRGLAEYISRQAGSRGMEVVACAEPEGLEGAGIRPGKCIDAELISAMTGRPCPARKDPFQRKACGCIVAKDIGTNGTCSFGCCYCYASR